MEKKINQKLSPQIRAIEVPISLQDRNVKFAQNSDQGLERQDNQDAMAWFGSKDNIEGELFILADGMGGEAGGRFAADMAISTIREFFVKSRGDSVSNVLKNSIEEANRRIYAKGTSGDLRYRKMGTTVAVLFIKNGNAYIAHDVDSRIYRYRKGNLERLTKDHSQVQQMVDGGLIKAEDADDHPDANIITRSLGAKPTIEVDIRLSEKILPGDTFLLCSDGLCGLVKDPEIRAILAQKKAINEICDNLISAALSRGGHDNVTVQLIAFEGEDVSEEEYKREGREERKNLPLLFISLGVIIFIGLAFFVLEKYRPNPPKQETPPPASNPRSLNSKDEKQGNAVTTTEPARPDIETDRPKNTSSDNAKTEGEESPNSVAKSKENSMENSIMEKRIFVRKRGGVYKEPNANGVDKVNSFILQIGEFVSVKEIKGDWYLIESDVSGWCQKSLFDSKPNSGGTDGNGDGNISQLAVKPGIWKVNVYTKPDTNSLLVKNFTLEEGDSVENIPKKNIPGVPVRDIPEGWYYIKFKIHGWAKKSLFE